MQDFEVLLALTPRPRLECPGFLLASLAAGVGVPNCCLYRVFASTGTCTQALVVASCVTHPEQTFSYGLRVTVAPAPMFMWGSRLVNLAT
jgi:hypothetical protein